LHCCPSFLASSNLPPTSSRLQAAAHGRALVGRSQPDSRQKVAGGRRTHGLAEHWVVEAGGGGHDIGLEAAGRGMEVVGVTSWNREEAERGIPSRLAQEDSEFFIYFFYHNFAKIYGPLEILQNYTSVVVAHGVRDVTSWPTAVGAASRGPIGLTAAGHGIRDLTPCPAALGP
jgi:hypothetical protein